MKIRKIVEPFPVGTKVKLTAAYINRRSKYITDDLAAWKLTIDFGEVTRHGQHGQHEVRWTRKDGTQFTSLWFAKSNLRAVR